MIAGDLFAAFCRGQMLLSPVAHGGVIGTNDSVAFREAPPGSAAPRVRGAVQSDRVQVFNERQNVRLPRDTPWTEGGVILNAHYVIYDPELRHLPGAEKAARFSPPAIIRFDGPIVAVLSGDADLDGTDALFGLEIRYPTGVAQRGTAGGTETGDSFSVEGNTLTIFTLFVRDSRAEPGIDHLRVLTRSAVH